jgi:hypothetical protein
MELSRNLPGGQRKPTESFSQDSRSPGRDLKPELPEYEAGALSIPPRRSVSLMHINYSKSTLHFRSNIF